jgi:hypothetical protein
LESEQLAISIITNNKVKEMCSLVLKGLNYFAMLRK